MPDLDIPLLERELTPAPTSSPIGAVSPSPYNFLFTGEDRLRLTSYNSKAGVTLALHGRMWSPRAGIVPFAFKHAPNTDRTARAETFQIGEGYLLNATIFPEAGAPLVGHTYARVQVIRGDTGATTVLGTLIQDYVTAGQDIAWPGSPLRNSLEPGYIIHTIDGQTSPLATEISQTVPTGAVWEILAFAATFTADATAVTRFPMLHITQPSVGVSLSVLARDGVGASATREYAWGQGLPFSLLTPSTWNHSPLPAPLPLRAGTVISTETVNLQAGDRWGRHQFHIREWLEAA